jgi:predicted Fe-Mo cluster-binding NifX family protein
VKIAVTSQNRRTITEHAGRCRIFWLYQTEQGKVTGKALLSLPKEQCFHDSSPHEPHPLDEVQVLISGGMGQGLVRRLAMKGITGLVTAEIDPDKAVAAYLAGALDSGAPCAHAHGEEEHQHE